MRTNKYKIKGRQILFIILLGVGFFCYGEAMAYNPFVYNKKADVPSQRYLTEFKATTSWSYGYSAYEFKNKRSEMENNFLMNTGGYDPNEDDPDVGLLPVSDGFLFLLGLLGFYLLFRAISTKNRTKDLSI